MDHNKLLQEVITQAKQINIPISNNIDPTVLINTRAKGRFGQCKKRSGKFLIEVSKFLEQAGEEAVKQTLAHEILHTSPDCFNHKYIWQTYASKMNRAYGYDISRTDSCANLGIVSPKKRNYVIICEKCGRETVRERPSKLTEQLERYKCKCGGKLSLQK
jgi:predicted SprT family Zn-dependent metalloprotease